MENTIVNLNYELLFFGIILPILLGNFIGMWLIKVDNKRKFRKEVMKKLRQEPKFNLQKRREGTD
tara:strand:- start:634 stop:828 length:195 start_codon:yes stop_codon:yes gene_type:complete